MFRVLNANALKLNTCAQRFEFIVTKYIAKKLNSSVMKDRDWHIPHIPEDGHA